MAKALNVVFGIGTAVISFILLLLAIQTAYPGVEYDDYCNVSEIAHPVFLPERCADNMTVAECRNLTLEPEAFDNQCYAGYAEALKIHNKNVFIIASLVGAALILLAFFILSLTNISAGIMSAGIALLIYAFSKGWNSAEDVLKLIIAALIAALVIILALAANKKLSKKK